MRNNIPHDELTDYSRGAPSFEAEQADSTTCSGSQCPICSWNGLMYYPYTKPGSYRAFAVCPECGYTEEF